MSAFGAVPKQQAAPRAKTLGGSKTCFKCGKPGHWSRECTAPREEWVPSTYNAANAAPRAQGGATTTAAPAGPTAVPATAEPGAFEDDPPADDAAAAAAKKLTQRRLKRRQLTVLDLTGAHGLKAVYTAFQKEMRSGFKGRGHEATDLKRLLDLYRGWHRRLFPDVPFEVFVEKCEALGAKRPLQSYLRELRSADVNMGTHFEGGGAHQRDGDDDDVGAGFGAWATEAALRGGATTVEAVDVPAATAPAAEDEDDELGRLIALEQDDDDDDDAFLDAMGQ